MKNENNQYEKIFEVDMDTVLKDRFEAGKGVILMQHDMPETALLLAIKSAASFGKPFTVVPPFEGDKSVAEKHASPLGNLVAVEDPSAIQKEKYDVLR